MTFKRVVPTEHLSGSLWFELEGVTTEQIRKAFGPIPREVGKSICEKYSKSFFIKSRETGCTYALYTCYGVWRVGQRGRADDSDRLEITKLLQLN